MQRTKISARLQFSARLQCASSGADENVGENIIGNVGESFSSALLGEAFKPKR